MKTKTNKQQDTDDYLATHPTVVRVHGCGPSFSPIMIVGEAPGADEEQAARRGQDECIMIGPTGALANKLIQEASDGAYGLRSFYRTNVEKYHPPHNKLSNLRLIGKKPFEDVDDLFSEIYSIKPKVILAFGGHALKALTGLNGITRYRGSILPLRDTVLPKVIATFHPASFLHGKGGEAPSYKAWHWVKHDIKRAIEESEFSELRLPERKLEICRSYADFDRFLAQYADQKRVSVDIETVKCIPTCLGFAFSQHHAMSVPLLNISDVQLSDQDHALILQRISSIFDDPTIELIGQNWKFDQKKLEKPFGFRFRCKLWMDTAIAAHVLYPEFPKKLEFLTSIFTREPYYKDELKEFDFLKESYEKILVYNGKDVTVTFEIAEKLESELRERNLWSFFQNFVSPLHNLYKELEEVGILSDSKRRLELWREYSIKAKDAQLELDELAGRHVNVRSPKDIPWFISFLGLPQRDSYDEDNLVALIGNHAKRSEQRRGLDLILNLRKIEKFKSSYLAAKPDYDGRMRTRVNLNSNESGRTSDNILKPPERPHSLGLPFKLLSRHGDIGPEIRETLIPDPGYCFVEVDSRQAEARVLALLAGDYELLKEFETTDVYKTLATAFFHKDFDSITNDERYIGKVGRLSGGYGAGKRRWMITINTDARRFKILTPTGEILTVSEKQCGEFHRIFHEEMPKLRGTYFPGIAAALKRDRMRLRTPFGRERLFTDRFDDSLLRDAYSYIPQSTIGDNTKRAMMYVKARRPDTRICIEAHDSFTALIPLEEKEFFANLFKEAMEQPIDFSNCSIPRGTIIVPAEVKIGFKNLRNMEVWNP